MNLHSQLDASRNRIHVYNFLTEIPREETVSSILSDLQSNPRKISSKFLYDSKGSLLFKEITKLPEYYLSRIESELIKKYVELHSENLNGIDIIELGSGDCSKISLILQSASKHTSDSLKYIPFDVSIEALLESAQILTKIYPTLEIDCIVGDFFSQLNNIPCKRKKLFCFFGSTIGNFTYVQRIEFFRNISLLMNPGDAFLLGVDMLKDQILLEKAYNDSQQVTSQFNHNILNVVNSLAGTDFNPDQFEHLAFFNNTFSRIEMHLRALQNITVHITGSTAGIYIPEGQTIHTENSYKFTYNQIVKDLHCAHLQVISFLSDSNNWFSLFEIVKHNI